MAQILFKAGEDFVVNNLSGSGLGFYANDFGASIAIGSYNGRTFITDSTGTVEGPEVDNCKYYNSTTCVLGQSGSGISLLRLPNYLATLNVEFVNDTAVKVQNAKVYVYDRVSKNNSPSGITCYLAQIIHPDTYQSLTGSGNSTWTSVYGSGSVLSLSASPGLSGLSPNGPNTTDTVHDYYLAMSATPTSVGAKSFALMVELEYL